jgi:cysteine desulfurase family protein (TIGR01976 family)
LALNLDFVRSRFPALSKDTILYFDNAGGSLVPETVAARVHDYLTGSSVQHGANYTKSLLAADRLRQAEASIQTLINAARREEVVMGPSSTILLKLLADNFARTLAPGDEIIVSAAEHEANFSCWRALQAQGINIVLWEPDPRTWLLDPQTLTPLITDKTRLLCMTHVSNILGAINPVKEITALAHRHNIRVIVDGVAFSPHRQIDVQDMDVDFYIISLYKTFGPHHGVLYGKYEQLLALPGNNHSWVARDHIPYKFQPGGVNYELSWGAGAILEYLLQLADPLAGSPASDFELLRRSFDNIAAHEQSLSEHLLGALAEMKAVRIIGPGSADRDIRVPTISFVAGDKSSKYIVEALDPERFGMRYGHFYSIHLIKALGLMPQDGVIRVSMVHYNTIDELDQLIEALRPLINN